MQMDIGIDMGRYKLFMTLETYLIFSKISRYYKASSSERFLKWQGRS